ncbi:MAG: methanogen output domain 1-containing protein [Euryarchaeota archaeon]|nr:methanogen output domain 1-containing protein [Euryarchaeota archaeon]
MTKAEATKITQSKADEEKFEKYYMHFLAGELMHEVLFGTLPNKLKAYEGMEEEEISRMLREISAEAIVNAINLGGVVSSHVALLESFEDKVTLCYKIYESMGFKFCHNIFKETKDSITIQVTECPHIEYTKKNPLACFSCMGLKLGILKVVFGIDIKKLNVPKRLALGDDCCLIEIPKK